MWIWTCLRRTRDRVPSTCSWHSHRTSLQPHYPSYTHLEASAEGCVCQSNIVVSESRKTGPCAEGVHRGCPPNRCESQSQQRPHKNSRSTSQPPQDFPESKPYNSSR